MKIKPEETELYGRWVKINNKIEPDFVTKRINWLISNFLIKIKMDESGWNILYKDPIDGRYWELFYPENEMHGAGPPALRVMLGDELNTKYYLINK